MCRKTGAWLHSVVSSRNAKPRWAVYKSHGRTLLTPPMRVVVIKRVVEFTGKKFWKKLGRNLKRPGMAALKSVVSLAPGGAAMVAASDAAAADRRRRRREAQAAKEAALREEAAQLMVQEIRRKQAKKAMKKIKGQGAYMANMSGRGAYFSNSLVVGRPENGVPSFGADSEGEVIVTRNEYLMDINSQGSTAFYTTSFSLNPGLPGTFPWASQVAENYDEYELLGCIFYYKPIVSELSTGGAMGTVLMATQYNAAATPFTTKPEMVEYSGVISGRICDELVHGVECDPTKRSGTTGGLVRAGAVPSGEDVKTYDMGIFNVAISGVSTSYAAGTQLGELWVAYKLKLRKPKFWNALGYAIQTDAFVGVTGVTTALPLGTAPKKSAYNGIGGVLSKATATVYTFPDNFVGTVRVIFVVNAGTTVGTLAASSAVVGAGNLTVLSNFSNDGGVTTAGSIAIAGGATAIYIRDYSVLQASSSGGNTITFTCGTITGGATGSELFIFEVNKRIGNATQFNAF